MKNLINDNDKTNWLCGDYNVKVGPNWILKGSCYLCIYYTIKGFQSYEWLSNKIKSPKVEKGIKVAKDCTERIIENVIGKGIEEIMKKPEVKDDKAKVKFNLQPNIVQPDKSRYMK